MRGKTVRSQVAIAYLRAWEEDQTCQTCRQDVTAVRMLAEDLAALQAMQEDLHDHPRRREWLVRLVEVADRLGVLAFVARIYGIATGRLHHAD